MGYKPNPDVISCLLSGNLARKGELDHNTSWSLETITHVYTAGKDLRIPPPWKILTQVHPGKQQTEDGEMALRR